MKRLLLVLLFVLLAPFEVRADPLRPLRRALALAHTDTAKARYYWLASEVVESNDSIRYFAQQAMLLLERALPTVQGAERRRLLRLLGGAVNNLGVGYSDGGKEAQAETLFLRAARLRQQGGDVRGQVESLANLASILHSTKHDYAEALRYYQQGVRAGEHVPAARSVVTRCLSGLGNLYGLLGDQGAELRYNLRALALLEQEGEPLALLDALTNLSHVYLDGFNDTIRAEGYARRAQQLALETPGTGARLSNALLLRGRIRLRQHRLRAARALLLEARQFAGRLQTTYFVAQAELYLALTEEEAHHLPLALRHARQAVVTAGRGSSITQRDAELIQSRLYEKLAQPQAALDHYRRYIVLRDSVQNEQNQKAAYRQRLSYEFAGREARLKAAQERRQAVAAAEVRRQRQLRTATSLGAGGLLLLATGLYHALRRAERLKQLVTNQKQNLQAQRDRLDTSLTELRATQARLIQQEKMASLGELTAGVAHEIQNPLNFVNNFADVSTELLNELEEAQTAGDAEEVTALVADVRQNLTKITEHGQRAAGIIKGMLEHSRPSTGEWVPTDVNALCGEYLRLAYQTLRATDETFKAELKTDLEPGLGRVLAVPGDLGRVLLNLLGNAFYAVRQRQLTGELGYQPTVGVATKPVGQQVEIRVTDNGMGISEDLQQKIFQPFFTTKPPGEGTGLGLSLSYNIVTQGHGGRLHVESRPGQGSTFLIQLPLRKPVISSPDDAE
ncbi:hypothetical protein KBK19_19790 [Microvirga sp. STR05]|nr:ATP-binding protein [Hymenobacter duratus]MBR7952212.1 hypothetical protein [Microvirga sp. STR05]